MILDFVKEGNLLCKHITLVSQNRTIPTERRIRTQNQCEPLSGSRFPVRLPRDTGSLLPYKSIFVSWSDPFKRPEPNLRAVQIAGIGSRLTNLE